MFFLWINSTGKSGYIEADNEDYALALLQYQVKDVKKIRRIGRYNFMQASSLNQKIKAEFLIGIGELLEAQFTLAKSLKILAQSHKHPILQDLINIAHWRLESGDSFGAVLTIFSQHFDALQIHCIQIAEQTGDLARQLITLGHYYQMRANQSQKIKQALRYPGFLLLFAVIIASVLLVVVVPNFAQTFTALDAEIPRASKIIIEIALIFKSHFGLILLGLSISILSPLFIVKYHPQFRYLIKTNLMRSNYLRKWYQLDTQLYFAQSFLNIYSTNLSIEMALKLMLQSNKEVFTTKILQSILQQLQKGLSMQEAIKEHPIFDTNFQEIFQVADNSERIQLHLQRMVKVYQKILQSRIDNITKWLEPAVIIFVGTLIGLMMILIYLPLFQLGQIY